jgi:hypothetical protein
VHGCLNIRVFATVQTRDQLLGTVAWWYSPFVQIARSAISLQSAWSTTVALIEHSPALEARRTNLASIRDLVLSHEPTAEELADKRSGTAPSSSRRMGPEGSPEECDYPQPSWSWNRTLDRQQWSGTVAAARLLDPQARAPNHRTRCHSLNTIASPQAIPSTVTNDRLLFWLAQGGVPSNGQESNHRAR